MLTSSDNYISMVKNSTGRRRIVLQVFSNPQQCYLSSDIPGKAVNAKIVHCYYHAPLGTTMPDYVQIDMGEACHKETVLAVGCKPSCFQVPLIQAPQRVPIKFNSFHLPQQFQLSFYGPGENASLLPMDPDLGALVIIEYEYIST